MSDQSVWALRTRMETHTGLWIERICRVAGGPKEDWWRVVLTDDLYVMDRTRTGALRKAMVRGALATPRAPLVFGTDENTRRIFAVR